MVKHEIDRRGFLRGAVATSALLMTGYMFPRRDGIVLGGTFDHDDWSLQPNPQQTTEILEGHEDIMKQSGDQ